MADFATSDGAPKEEPNLGAFARNTVENEGREPFYLTTAIAYMNGYPHIGHAYEFVTSDIISRLHRMLGYDTYFLTGADEHGQKVEASARKMERSPIEHCNTYVAAFEDLNTKLGISNDDYIRTTQERHKKTCQKLWQICAKSDDIYLNYHEGWYNEREECYVTEMDAQASDYKDPGNGVPYKRVSEETYFFRMSKYADRLIAHIEENPTFCEPELARNEILARLRAPEGLKDLCISRTTFSWGIPVPAGFDDKHIMYVWFDALTNYLSGVGALDEGEHSLKRYWPAAMHVIGKDIKWFHCVIWPTMLMSAGLPLPKSVFSHGFVNAADGRKMSKTYNNTIDPHDMLSKYPLDTLRYYITSSDTYGVDLSFSEANMVQMHNSELADVLGNLLHRALNLSHKYCAGVVPDVQHDLEFHTPFDLAQLKDEITALSNSCALHAVAFKAMEAVRATNRFLTEAEPWKMKGEGSEGRRQSVVRTTLEAIYAFSHCLGPMLPFTAAKIFEKLGTPPTILPNIKPDFYNLKPGTALTVGEILFTKIDTGGGKDEDGGKKAAGGGDKSGAKTKNGGGKSTKAAPADPNQPDFTKMEIRVGLINKAWHHETAEKLFCEEIDMGTEVGVRQVASGLRQHYTLEQMTGRRVLVVCNLKAAKMQGFESAGMVLAATHADGRVELVAPPDGAEVGEMVTLSGLEMKEGWEPWAANKVSRNKVFNLVAPDLKTDSSCQVVWKDMLLVTSAGPCTVPSCANAQVA